MKKINPNKKIIALSGVFLLFLVLAVTLPNTAHADVLGISFNPITWVAAGVKVIAYIINFFMGFLFEFAGWLVKIAMDINNDILGTSNTIVKVGWVITRDIANLGFVLIMVVMAVATIVRYEKYSAKKLLPILIGAAIIVNFSLTIAGVFINFSNILASTFINGVNAVNIQDSLASAFGPQRLLLKDTDNPSPPDPSTQGGALMDFSSGGLISIMGSVFSIVFLAIATLSMATLALMLLYRYVILSILLVLAPLTWMFWVFPDLKSLFNKWWDTFIKWVFFLPATTFFLYLAIQAANAMKDNTMFSTGSGFSGSIADIMKQGAQMVVLTGLLLGGLMAAQKMGIEVAGGALNLAKKTGGAIRGYAGMRAQQLATAPLRASWGKTVTEKMQTFGQNSKFAKFTGLATLTQKAGNSMAVARMAQEKKAADAAKKLPKDLREQALMAADARAPEQVAIMASLAKEWNKRNDESNKKSNKVTDANKEYENAKKALEKEEDSDFPDSAKLAELKNKVNITKTALDSANTDRNKGNKDLDELESVMKLLPKNIREGLEKSVDDKGKMQMKNVKLGKFSGYIGRR